MKMKRVSSEKIPNDWRVILPSGSVIDFSNCEPQHNGNTLTFWRGNECIATFQTWAAFHVLEPAK